MKWKISSVLWEFFPHSFNRNNSGHECKNCDIIFDLIFSMSTLHSLFRTLGFLWMKIRKNRFLQIVYASTMFSFASRTCSYVWRCTFVIICKCALPNVAVVIFVELHSSDDWMMPSLEQLTAVCSTKLSVAPSWSEWCYFGTLVSHSETSKVYRQKCCQWRKTSEQILVLSYVRGEEW